MLLEYMDAAVTRATTAYRSPESSWEYDEPPVSAKAPESAPDEPSETLADDLVVSGVARPWTRENNRFFGPLKCKACGEDLQLHQPVVERPIMSVNFYHVMKEDCAALMEGVEVPE
jgi:hypothetical protein